MFVSETLGAFQLDDEHIFDEKIGEVFPHAMALVSYWERDLGSSPDTPKAEFVKQSALVDFLQESRAQSVGYLENSPQHPLR
jgi:hypothetical protein